MTRPVIGVTLSTNRSRAVWWMHKLAILRAGGSPVKLTPASGLLLEADGYVIGGGSDIGLEINGMTIDPSVQYDAERDALELETLQHAFKSGKPALGICRGSQMINVARGGSLYADLSDYKPGLKRQRLILPRKTIDIEDGSMLYRLLNKKTLSINALHHQSVNKLGKGLKVVARDLEGIVQAIECIDDGSLLGVQWHPELIPWSRSHNSLFRWLVDRAR